MNKWADTLIQSIIMVLAVWATMKRYINGGVQRIESKLDDHIDNTAARDEKLDKLGEDVSGIKGYLGIGMPTRGNLH